MLSPEIDSVDGQRGADRDFASEYRSAVREEAEARDFAFLGLPRDICGVPVEQMTLRQLLVRLMIGCPFFGGNSEPAMEDVANFLWHLSPDFIPADISKESWKSGKIFHRLSSWVPAFLRDSKSVRARRRFIRKIVFPNGATAERVRELESGIREYLEWTFYDAPPTSDGGSAVAYTSFVAGYLDVLASQYEWSAVSDKPALDTPLVVIYQLVRKIQKRNDPKNAVFMNRRSDKIRGEYYAEKNRTAESAVPPPKLSTINSQPSTPPPNG